MKVSLVAPRILLKPPERFLGASLSLRTFRKEEKFQQKRAFVLYSKDIMADPRDRRTLVRPPPLDPTKSQIENVLELTELSAIQPDMFTNTRPLWQPTGARGIYGGAVIAQCLAAAQRTVPSNFTVHSMHCYFVLAGDSTIPVMYYVEHVREGRSFATRTVQARQRGKAIFTTTMSFVRENSGGKKTVNHAVALPDEIQPPTEENSFQVDEAQGGPFTTRLIEMKNKDSKTLHEKRARYWMKARGKISEEGGHEAHISALAYMSDSHFIGTVTRIHDISRPTPHAKNEKEEERPQVGMVVSLDHSIYFHEPRLIRADEWMFAEMSSPWSGDGRGVVMQHIFAQDGTLIATCTQEGVVRLKEARVLREPKL